LIFIYAMLNGPHSRPECRSTSRGSTRNPNTGGVLMERHTCTLNGLEA